MPVTPVIAVFDVGKTNKKVFLFDQQYRMVWERSARFSETVDEDGDGCENLDGLRLWLFDSLTQILRNPAFEIKAINFSTYGASFVYLAESGHAVAPLYNYLKAYPEDLKEQFYKKYGGEEAFSVATASPVLGSLNSGMQLYRLKHQKPEVFAETRFALHLPQYLHFLLTGHAVSDLTSIGCHTALWDFTKGSYHQWVTEEGVDQKLAPIAAADETRPLLFPQSPIQVGTGLHDSSAALIPYLVHFKEPFVLLSTGTWCISLNPFNWEPLTPAELKQDCLCYLTYQGAPVKASRLFAGHEHEQQAARISSHFGVAETFYYNMPFNAEMYSQCAEGENGMGEREKNGALQTSLFSQRDLSLFPSPEAAYHQLIFDLVQLQKKATNLVLEGSPVKRLFVDGGFSKNAVYMTALAAAYEGLEVFAASMAQATALGAALVLHHRWNNEPLPAHLISLKQYHSSPVNALS